MKARNFFLVSQISRGIWHMSPDSVYGLLPVAVNFLKGNDIQAWFGDDDEINHEAKKAKMERWKSQFSASTELFVEDWYYDYLPLKINGDVVVIPVMGAIMQEDYCGSPGTKTIQSWYEKAANDPEVKGIIELCNSGGGSVFGTHELAQYKVNYPKPILTLCEGLCCSAMEYIAAGSKYRMATSPNCIWGSVGVMTTFVDFKEYYKNEGIDVIDLYSKTSPKKNEAYRQASDKKDFRGYTDGVLFKLDTSFMDFVKVQLPNISEEALQGADYTTSDAIKNGLCDGMGTFQDAYNKVIQMASEASSNNNTPNKMEKKTVKMSAIVAKVMTYVGAAEIVDDVSETDENKGGSDGGDEEEEENDNPTPPNQPTEGGDEEEEEEQPDEEEDLKAKVERLEAENNTLKAKNKALPANSTTKFPKAKQETPKPVGTQKKEWYEEDSDHVKEAKARGLL